MNTIRLAFSCVVLATLHFQLSTALAQGTAFTYQGVLSQNGVAANGSNDFTFTLHDAAGGGSTIGAGNVVNDVVTTNGLFLVALDFGAGAFNGAPRWLQIAVRPGASTGAYTNLAPRQAITPTPYAIYASGASAVGLSGTISGSQIAPGAIGTTHLSNSVSLWNRSGNNIHYTAGSVGVGTNAPAARLHVADSFEVSGPSGRFDVHATFPPLNGTVLLGAFSGTDTNGAQLRFWRTGAPSFMDIGQDGNGNFVVEGGNDIPRLIVQNGGNVGIGTTTPSAPLDVLGRMRVNTNGTIRSSTVGLGSFNGMIEAYYADNDRYGLGQLPNGITALYSASSFSGSSIQFGQMTGATNFSPQMIINHAGHVGIGTNNPAARLHVNGTVTATSFIGDGSGLTGISGGSTNASALTSGTLADARLSANVALRNGGNNFSGSQSISGGVIVDSAGANTGAIFGSPGLVFGDGVSGEGIASKRTAGGNQFGLDLFTGYNPRLSILGNGNVGIGTTTPARKLTVNASSYGIEHTDGTVRLSTYLSASGGWLGTVSAHDLNFFVNDGSAALKIDINRNATFAGEVTGTAVNITSDRNAKEQFKPINSRDVLAKVVGLPISEWQYKQNGDARHIGPMAQDFREAFALGHDEKHIATVDADGVALAAIQGLNEKLEEQVRDKDTRIQGLEKAVRELQQLVNKLTTDQDGGAR